MWNMVTDTCVGGGSGGACMLLVLLCFTIQIFRLQILLSWLFSVNGEPFPSPPWNHNFLWILCPWCYSTFHALDPILGFEMLIISACLYVSVCTCLHKHDNSCKARCMQICIAAAICNIQSTFFLCSTLYLIFEPSHWFAFSWKIPDGNW